MWKFSVLLIYQIPLITHQKRQVSASSLASCVASTNRPHHKCNLNGTVLNVSVNDWFPFCNIKKRNGKIFIGGFSMETELLKIFESQFNFKANLIDGQNTWGMNVNGTWTGVVGDVYYLKSHFAMCHISKNYERAQVVDFSEPIFQDEITFIAQHPGAKIRHWIILINVEFLIYGAIFAGVLLVYICLDLEAFCQQSLTTKIWGIFFRQSTHSVIYETRHDFKLIFSLCMVTSFVLVSLYFLKIYDILALQSSESPLNTIEELVSAANADSHNLLTLDRSLYHSNFLTATPGNRVYYAIGRHLNRTANQMFSRYEEQIALVDASPRNIVISNRIALQKRYTAVHRLHVAEENLDQRDICIIFQTGSPLVGQFSGIIKQFNHMGILEHLVRRTMVGQEIIKASGDKFHVKQFTIVDVKSIFYYWLIGIAIGSWVFTVEMCILLFTK